MQQVDKEFAMAAQQETLNLALDDNRNIEQRLGEMQVMPHSTRLKQFKERFANINMELKQIEYSLNNNQIACAIAALYEKKKNKQIFLTIPPGKGKSRVIAAIIAYKAAYENQIDFTILFSSDLLMSVD